MDQERALLNHFLAALAYRTQKALRGAPETFADFQVGNNTRTPHELIWHMTGVLGYARTFFTGGTWRPEKEAKLIDDVKRFHDLLEDLGRIFLSDAPMNGITAKQMLHGPLADAMTHVGQIAMLRRLAGAPIAPENFIRADIQSNNLSENQPSPAAPDPGWKPDLPPATPGKGLSDDW